MIKEQRERNPASNDNWVFLHASKILNIQNGFQISLIEGSWGAPKDLNVKASQDFPKIFYARQIREGVEYAQSESGIKDLALMYTKKPLSKK